MLSLGVEYERFAREAGTRLRVALTASYGPDVGADAAAEAMAYGWEHWSRVSVMDNAVGYLFRVGQTAARRLTRRHGFLPTPATGELPTFEPRLVPALEALSDAQRTCVMLVHAFAWTYGETAELLGVEVSTVRTHVARGMARLQTILEVVPDAH